MQGEILVRNSERSTWRRCRLKWKWSYVDRLSVKREKGALAFGTLVHAALERYYVPGNKRGVHPAKTFYELYTAGNYGFDQWDDDGNRVDACELGVEMLKGYVARWGKDDHIKILQPEQVLAVDVMDAQGKYLFTWVGKADAVYEDLSRSTPRRRVFGMLEHKTAKTIDEGLRVNTGYGDQALAYFWALEQHAHHVGWLPEGQHISHVMFNWLRKALPSDKPRDAEGRILNKPKKDVLIRECNDLGIPTRGMLVDDLMDALRKAGRRPELLGEPAQRQPGPLFLRDKIHFHPSQLAEFNQRLRSEGREMQWARNGLLSIYKNPTKDCKWDCPFVEVCEVHEMGAPGWREMLDMEFTQWNPYEEHELEMEKS